VIQLDADRVVCIQRPRDADQHLGEVRKDAPIARLVGVGQRRARRATAEASVIEFAAHGAKAGFDVAQAFAVSQLGKSHRQKLIPARETLQVIVASITGDAFLKLLVGKILHPLRKDGLSEIHASLSPLSQGHSQCRFSWFSFQIVPDRVCRQLTAETRRICSQQNFPRTAVIFSFHYPLITIHCFTS